MIKTKDFKRLQKEWYDKLKEDGFSDIEVLDSHGNIRVDRIKTRKIPKYKADLMDDIYYYYHSIRSSSFSSSLSPKDSEIMALYGEGVTQRIIGKKLGISHVAVGKRIRKIIALIKNDLI